MVHYSSALSAALVPHADVRVIADARTRPFYSSGQDLWPVDAKFHGAAKLRAQARAVQEGIESWRPDVVHFTNRSHLTFLLRSILRKYPVVSTVHDVVLHEGDSIPDRLINRYQKRIGDRYIVHGERSRELLAREGVPRDRIDVIPHGIFGPTDGAPSPVGSTALFFGRIRPYKGLPDFVAAIRAARVRAPGLVGVIAGSGDVPPLDNEAFRVRQGYVPDADTDALFRESLCVVCPYVSGTQSGVIALAYGHGRAVIATRVGDIPDVVLDGSTGFLVDAHRPDQIAEKLVWLAEHPQEASRMGEQAWAFARKELAWENVATKTLATYARAMGGP